MDRVPRLHRYDQGATTPCRSPGRTSFPSLGGTADGRLRFRRHRRQATNACGAAHIGHPVGPRVPGFSCGNDRGLPRSWGTLIVPMPCSATPAGPITPGHSRCAGAAPVQTTTKAPAGLSLKAQSHTAWALAVYASQNGSLHHHARLASGCRPGSTGRACCPQGSGERFQSCLLHRSSSFPKLRGARSVTLSART